MRGLTFEEAERLRVIARGDGSFYEKGTPEYDTIERMSYVLTERRCASVERVESEDEVYLTNRITDLGRLALRVSIPGAQVPIG